MRHSIDVDKKSRAAVLYDISKLSIQIQESLGVVNIYTAQRELLVSCKIPKSLDLTTDVGRREAAFLGLDRMLYTPAAQEIPEKLLYNPVTKQVARYSTPNTLTYSDNKEIDVHSEGLRVTISEEMIDVDARSIPQITLDYKTLTKVLASHRNS